VLILLALVTALLCGLPSWAGDILRVGASERGLTLTLNDRIAAAGRLMNADGRKVILDLSAPAILAQYGGEDPRTMTLALRSKADVRVAGAINQAPAVAVSVPAEARALPLPPVDGPAGRPLVVIDAGHGGHDPGAAASEGALIEKDLTLQAARAIRDKLLAGGRVRVALTRDDDRFLVLQERYGIARRLNADLFLSIHCDSAGNPLASGATAYTLSEIASDKEAARLAARENKADLIAGVELGRADPDLSSILIDLTQRETMTASAEFARLLQREAEPLIRARPAFHRMASFVVLKAPDVPSILFEMGYLSNQEDAAFLGSPAGHERVAESVRRAVEVHFARRLLEREQIASR
jgi:N-acetylmuramoyl-L-alanine amidase